MRFLIFVVLIVIFLCLFLLCWGAMAVLLCSLCTNSPCKDTPYFPTVQHFVLLLRFILRFLPIFLHFCVCFATPVLHIPFVFCIKKSR